MNKRDIVSSRTPGDTERKYAKRIAENEKKVESQNVDLASLILKVNSLNASINEVNFQIKEINQKCEDIRVSIEKMDIRLEAVEETSHLHTNKAFLDTLTQADIFTGAYNLLAENVAVNQQIQGIDDYNLVLLKLNNVSRYIPCFKYGTSYKGTSATKDTVVDIEEISITVENEIITNIISSNNILEIIGIF